MAPAGALGAIAVHSIRKGDLVLKKGTRIGEAEAAALQAAGIDEIVVARIEPGDVPEDEAAADIAAAVAGEGVRVDRAFTGRANLFAEAARSRDRAMVVADEAKPLARVAPYRVKQIGVVSTLLPGLADKVIEKTLKILGDRIAPAGAAIVAERRVPHESRALAQALDEVLQAGAELVIVFGASAIADRRDVIPAAVEAIGGTIGHFGMPVDPGNLLLIAQAQGRPVLGAPGCARSPKENGFDWVLMRLLAGLEVKGEDIAGMGVGGLLMEIVTRPQPREVPPPVAAPARSAGRRVGAIVLAAGRSTRMGGPNKLLEKISGKPLVRIAAEQALSSRAGPVVVVTGHERGKVEAALAGLDVRLV